MTSRDEPAPGGATLASPPLHNSDSRGRPASTRRHSDGSPPPWDELLEKLAPEQQVQLLRLAQKQGLLYDHQIPILQANEPAKKRHWLHVVLHDEEISLPPLHKRSLTPFDEALDDCQREAVVRAVSSRDVALIAGPPGSGKSRTLVEVLRQCIAQGERALLVSTSLAALDRAVVAVADDEAVCAIRCLTGEEQMETLAEEVREHTLEARVQCLKDVARRSARENVTDHEERLRQREREQRVWEGLDKLAQCQADLDRKLDAASQAHAQAEQRWNDEIEAVRASSEHADRTPFQKKLAHCIKRRLSGLSRLEKDIHHKRKRLEASQVELERARAEAAQLCPVEAKRRRGWLFGLIARARRKAAPSSEALARHADAVERLNVLEKSTAEFETELQSVVAEHAARQRELRSQEDALVDEEIRLRRRELDREKTLLEQEAALIRRQWEEALAQLPHEEARPNTISSEELEQARQRWKTFLKEQEHLHRFARRWEKCLRDAAKSFPARIARSANLVAATPDALACHALFGEGARPAAPFDVVLVEEADLLSEAQLRSLVRRAPRCVLVGTSIFWSNQNESGAVFARLLHRLHPSARQLPVRWRVHDGRLCCRLIPLTDEQHEWIESEPVADREDIEVGILVEPDQDPVLAEVHFPVGMKIDEAKEYIYKELEAVTAQSSGSSLTWSESDAQLTAFFSPRTGDLAPVQLENGVMELLAERSDDGPNGDAPFETVAFQFDRAEGWDADRAERWLEQNLGLLDLQRSVRLTRLHRMSPELASRLQSWLNDEELDPNVSCEQREWNGWSTALGFVDVAAEERGELDLSVPEEHERLSGELRSVLPRRGLVNVGEAQAVVQALERLLNDEAFRNDAIGWQDQLPVHKLRLAMEQRQAPVRLTCSPTIAVTALYATQVQLIQHLLRQSRRLARKEDRLFVAPSKPECSDRTDFFAILSTPSGMITIEVGAPAVMRQRECLLLLLSLTRCTASSPAPYGDGPEQLLLSLSRARQRVLLFGDRDTLRQRAEHVRYNDTVNVLAAKESQWAALMSEHLRQWDQAATFELH